MFRYFEEKRYIICKSQVPLPGKEASILLPLRSVHLRLNALGDKNEDTFLSISFGSVDIKCANTDEILIHTKCQQKSTRTNSSVQTNLVFLEFVTVIYQCPGLFS